MVPPARIDAFGNEVEGRDFGLAFGTTSDVDRAAMKSLSDYIARRDAQQMATEDVRQMGLPEPSRF